MDKQSMAWRYFRWLYDQVYSVADEESPDSYTVLCYAMDRVNFIPSIPNDDNRANDAIQLREEFRDSLTPGELSGFSVWEWEKLIDFPPNIFEVLVSLAKHAEFMTGKPVSEWFAEFVANLKLGGYSDEAYELQDESRINRILQRFNMRRYDSHGRGGIFPLRRPEEDQREVELWYQLAAYATENGMY